MARDDDGSTVSSLKPSVQESVKRLPKFPGDCPSLHQGKLWTEALDDETRVLRLQPILANQLPLRVQHLRNWPEELCEVSAAVLATADDATAYKLRVDAAGRAKQNDKNNNEQH